MKILRNNQKENIQREKITGFLWFILLFAPLVFMADKIRNYTFFFHALLLITGGLSWTYTEYFFHRFIMHKADNSKGIAKLLNHTHHHTDPGDIRVTTPHRVIMISGTIILIAFSVLLNNYFTLLCGYFAGFTVFCLIHVVLHQPWSKKIFPQLHKFHIQHHCKHSDKCFGVTLTWWDHLFGTVQQNEINISTRILGFYYKKKKKGKKVISLNNMWDEKIQVIEKQSA